MPKLSELTDIGYTDPMGNALPVEKLYPELQRVYVNEPAVEQPSKGSIVARGILDKLFGQTGERYQLWPEKIVRDALSAAHDVKEGKELSNIGLRREDVTDKPVPQRGDKPDMPGALTSVAGGILTPTASSPQDSIIEKAQAISALAGTGGLAGGAEGAVLNATPSLRPALKHKERLYKGKPGQEHQDIIPDALYNDFQKKALAGQDLAEYNFGFINDKGHFMTREDALKYGIDNGIIDPHSGKYGALTTTLLSDSSKPGVAIEAMAKTAPQWKIKGFEDYNDWFHGTTHNFDKFSVGKGNPENYLGKYPHFTNSSKDASANYAGVGPDLTNRIEALAENLMQNNKKEFKWGTPEYEAAWNKAKAKATDKLTTHGGFVIPTNLKLNNPVSLVDSRPTWLDFSDSALATKLHKSLQKQAQKYGFDADEVMAGLSDNIYGEIKASDFDKALRSNEALMYAENPKDGKLVSSHIISNIYKDLGFDGIVMDAKTAFPNMKDIPDGTLHAAPLKRNTVQSKITGQTLFNESMLPAGYQLLPVDYDPFASK